LEAVCEVTVVSGSAGVRTLSRQGATSASGIQTEEKLRTKKLEKLSKTSSLGSGSVAESAAQVECHDINGNTAGLFVAKKPSIEIPARREHCLQRDPERNSELAQRAGQMI
jgi:hypothetical protein